MGRPKCMLRPSILSLDTLSALLLVLLLGLLLLDSLWMHVFLEPSRLCLLHPSLPPLPTLDLVLLVVSCWPLVKSLREKLMLRLMLMLNSLDWDLLLELLFPLVLPLLPAYPLWLLLPLLPLPLAVKPPPRDSADRFLSRYLAA